jgi:hypothetical protein
MCAQQCFEARNSACVNTCSDPGTYSFCGYSHAKEDREGMSRRMEGQQGGIPSSKKRRMSINVVRARLLRCPPPRQQRRPRVNLASKIYHFAGHKSYGTTKAGAYMCEKEATAQGFRASKTEKRPSA